MFKFFAQENKPAKHEFKFSDPEKACFACDHVLDGERPILFVTHDRDGDWQFLCGQNDHTEENASVISMQQAAELDPTVNELYEMPIGVAAQRKSEKDKWVPFRL